MVLETVPADARPARTRWPGWPNGGTILGVLVGAGVVALVGPGGGSPADAASFALAALCYARMRPGLVAARVGRIVLSDLRARVKREFSGRCWIWIVAAQFTVPVIAAYVASTGGRPVVADGSFGRAGWGLVVAAQAVCLAVGDRRVARRRVLDRCRTRPSYCPSARGARTVAVVLPSSWIAPGSRADRDGALLHRLGPVAPDQRPARCALRVYSYDMVGSFVAVPRRDPVGPPTQSPVLSALDARPRPARVGCGRVDAAHAA